MTPAQCFKEAAEMGHSLIDGDNPRWDNAIMQYMDALLARAAEEDRGAQATPEAAALADWLQKRADKARGWNDLCIQVSDGDKIIAALRGKGEP